MALNYDKDNVFHFLKKVNQDLSFVVSEMKQEFEQNPPTAQIKERFLKWKNKYQEVITQGLNEYIFTNETDRTTFEFKDFLNKITEEYQNENEYLEMLKTLNQEIEGLKEFIKTQLIKDPSIYYVKEI